MKCRPLANWQCRTVLMLTLLGMTASAFAEGRCPPGFYPTGGADVGWYSCAPMGPIEEEDEEDVPAQPEESIWDTRWGAIATADGAFGIANDMASKVDAENQAMSDCNARSDGRPCKLKPAFYNQCAALAWGDTFNVMFRSPDLKDAEDSALERCSTKTPNCKLYYSACSYPKERR